MELPKFVTGDNTDFPDDIFIIRSFKTFGIPYKIQEIITNL